MSRTRRGATSSTCISIMALVLVATSCSTGSGPIGAAVATTRTAARAPSSLPPDTSTGGSTQLLQGKWVNTDANARGTEYFVLAERNGDFVVHGFGACEGEPCDWGEVSGLTYAEEVESTDATAFTAHYDRGFADTIIAGYLSDGTLTVGNWTTFKDDSDRSSHYSVETFTRSSE